MIQWEKSLRKMSKKPEMTNRKEMIKKLKV